ncbi:heparinase II/III family protein [Spirosoma soli]|uniref:Heparinase II/III family protein n=1 Tax=Spirosoma soli TaxID=1770529 RepID=A0ABW5LW29_9BACT
MNKLFFVFVSWFVLAGSCFCRAQSSLPSSVSLNGSALQHPYLVLTKAQFDTLRQEIQSTPWKQQSWKQLQATAEKYLQQPVEIPPRGGNWDHYYISPTTANNLKKGRQIGDWQWEHVDVKTGEVFRGDTSVIAKDYDGVVIGFIHDALAIGVLQLGLAYQVSHEKKYADKARAILLAYAERYARFPRIDNQGVREPKLGGTRIYKQTLNEAIWLMDLVQGTDLIWDMLSPTDRKQLNEKLFYPSAKMLRAFEYVGEVGNIQCWKNAAIGMVGFLNNDADLIHTAMFDSLRGYDRQLMAGLTMEGFQKQLSPGYHFYSLMALTNLAQASRNYGYPLRLLPLRRMFHAPLLLANGAMTLPAFNDSRMLNLRERSQRYLYEWGYSMFKDEPFRHVIYGDDRAEFTNLGAIFTGWALLYGEPNVSPPGPWYVYSKNFSEAGVGMLATWQGRDNLSFYLNYDSLHHWHGHYDELGFALFKGFEPISVVPGAVRYSSPEINEWNRTSFAHNTFVVNEKPQKKSKGQCLFFGGENRVRLMMTQTTNAYDSVRFIRSAALLNENLMLIIDQFQTPLPPQTLDIVYHQAGTWVNRPTGQSWTTASDKIGYNQVQDWQQHPADKGVSLATLTKAGREVSVHAASLAPMQVMTGYGKPDLGQNVPVMVFRQKTNQTAVAWCIDLGGNSPSVSLERVSQKQGKEAPESQAVKVTVKLSTGESWQIWANPDELALQKGAQVTKKLLTVEHREK